MDGIDPLGAFVTSTGSRVKILSDLVVGALKVPDDDVTVVLAAV